MKKLGLCVFCCLQHVLLIVAEIPYVTPSPTVPVDQWIVMIMMAMGTMGLEINQGAEISVASNNLLGRKIIDNVEFPMHTLVWGICDCLQRCWEV